MKAIILVGGYGTRLRPLTLTKAKPMVEFCNLPMMVHQIKALSMAGVSEVILAMCYRADEVRSELTPYTDEMGIKLTVSLETTPLGTAGPLALARDLLSDDGEPFFMFNSDVSCEFPLKEMMSFHRAHGGEGTIMTTKVTDPSKYGVIVKDDSNKIIHFVEKPKKFVGDEINAGLYVLSPSVLKRIEMRPTSIEKEIFPQIAAEGNLYCMTLEGYWMDVGQPKDFIVGTRLALKSLEQKHPEMLSKDAYTKECVMVHETAEVHPTALLGPNTVIGKNVKILAGARVRNSTVLDGSLLKEHAFVADSIVGWNNKIGRWARLENLCVTGDDVAVGDELHLNGIKVLPHKTIKESFTTEGMVIM